MITLNNLITKGHDGLYLTVQLLQDVLNRFDKLGALPDEFMATAGLWRMNRARNGKHLLSLLGCQARGNQRTALGGRFNDEHATRQPGNEAVALRKIISRCWRAQREFRNDAAVFRELLSKVEITRWINAINACANDRSRIPLDGKRGPMRRCINAQGQATHNEQSGLC